MFGMPPTRSCYLLTAVVAAVACPSQILAEEEPVPPAVLADAAKSDTPVYLINIGVDGLATDCRVLKSSGRPAEDALACRHYRNTHYGISRNDSGQPAEYLRLVHVKPSDFAKLNEEAAAETQAQGVVQRLVDAIKARDRAAFDRETAPQPLLIYRQGTQAAPVGAALTFEGAVTAFHGCEFLETEAMAADLVALKTKCGEGTVAASNLVIERGKVKVLYEFMPPLVVLKQ